MTATAAALLNWYDTNARALPWRAPPGTGPADPYHVWLSEIMLQQTVVATVKPYFERFIQRWPTVELLANAPREDVLAEWAGLGYYARARNLHKCAVVVANDHGGVFPDTEEGLRALPGIGPYTAGAIAAIAFNHPVAAVDGNVERVMTRLHAIETPLPQAKPTVRDATEALIPSDRPGDFAQALMDLGATICIAKSPRCMLCPWQAPCKGRERGIAPDLPRKAPKAAKPVRRNTVYVHFRPDGDVMIETRPDKGLLGGMIGFPGPAWTKDPPDDHTIAHAAPGAADWQVVPMTAHHVFTHFALILTVMIAQGPPIPGARYMPVAEAATAMPTVMRKALSVAQSARNDDPS
ncbi:MAG: A/G-specific adenine glycosylase [Pseudomonadota bacterium]